ncbi:unnamed protein product [Rotaria sp. Silwood2]|nr:unnamed protein product [Rotaria sp. Silwood2]CAF2515659.1 unnamed protein product [Rotaria sp. Silwood2]CAF2909247.1 unnamed protein product [Rotaria sp. Silwood2]CAF3864325.1 unnamed protein product [Rotaria sp. Silwood2]CAF3869633.1 unnamed protein product [Rotaria sp. Silwood2]
MKNKNKIHLTSLCLSCNNKRNLYQASYFRAWLKYKSDNIFAAGPVVIIPILALISICLILIFSSLYLWSGDTNTYSQSLWETFMRTLDPGSAAEDTGGIHRLISATVTMCGIFIISTLIGALTTGMEGKLAELRKGRTKVVETNHTIILGWSSKIFDIINELVIANENQHNPSIVILAPIDRIEMQEIISQKIDGNKNTKIICRNGDPMSIHDLNILSPNNARSIIILAPLNDNPDVSVIKTILAITNNPQRTKLKFHIVAEIKERNNIEVARIAGADEVVFVHADEIIARIIAQSGRQSGLSIILSMLLSFKYDEIYFKYEPLLVGKTFNDALFLYRTSSVIGLMFADETIKICPLGDTIINSNDQIIVIAEDDDAINISSNYSSITMLCETDISTITICNEKQMNIEKNIILGWNSKASLIAKQLDNYVSEGSELHILTNIDKAKKIITEQLVNELKRQKLYLHSGDITNRLDLEKLNLYNYHDVILLANDINNEQNQLDISSSEAADAECLICLLHLRNMIDKNPRQKTFNIVTEMFDIRNRELAEITRADDFIVSPNILSKYIAQISENKNLTKVFDVLLTAEGVEIYLKPVSLFTKLGVAIPFRRILEASLKQQTLAIGYRQMKYAQDSNKFYGIVLNPDKDVPIIFQYNDKIIVLAEE